MPAESVTVSANFVQFTLPTGQRIIENYGAQTAQLAITGTHAATGYFTSMTHWSGIVMTSHWTGRRCFQLSASGSGATIGRRGANFPQVNIAGAEYIVLWISSTVGDAAAPVTVNFRLETATTAAGHWNSPPIIFNEGDFGIDGFSNPPGLAKWIQFILPMSEFTNNAGAKLSEQATANITGWQMTAQTAGNYWMNTIIAHGNWAP